MSSDPGQVPEPPDDAEAGMTDIAGPDPTSSEPPVDASELTEDLESADVGDAEGTPAIDPASPVAAAAAPVVATSAPVAKAGGRQATTRPPQPGVPDDHPYVDDPVTKWWVGIIVAVFGLIVAYALLFGHGGILTPEPTREPIPTDVPSLSPSPAASGSASGNPSPSVASSGAPSASAPAVASVAPSKSAVPSVAPTAVASSAASSPSVGPSAAPSEVPSAAPTVIAEHGTHRGPLSSTDRGAIRSAHRDDVQRAHGRTNHARVKRVPIDVGHAHGAVDSANKLRRSAPAELSAILTIWRCSPRSAAQGRRAATPMLSSSQR